MLFVSSNMEENEYMKGVPEWEKYYTQLSNKVLAREFLSYDPDEDKDGGRGISLAEVVKRRSKELPPEIWAKINSLKDPQKNLVIFYLDAKKKGLGGNNLTLDLAEFLKEKGIYRLNIAEGMKMNLDDMHTAHNMRQIRAAFMQRYERGQEIYGNFLREYHGRKGLSI